MTKAIIIEHEKAASEYLIARLNELAPDIEVETILTDVAESIRYFSKGTTAAVIFSNVQLGDGLSFSIFENVAVNIPVIFMTACEKFMMSALEYNGIDYLLKPVSDDKLLKAVNKYRKLEKHFYAASHHLSTVLLQQLTAKKQARQVVRRGQDYLFLRMEDVVLYYTENKAVYLLDKNGMKYWVDKHLSDLEKELDSCIFFRANRQYIVNINYVKGYKMCERVKMQLDLHVPLQHRIVISQETAPLFKKWIYSV